MKTLPRELALESLHRNAVAHGKGWALGQAGQRWPTRVAWPAWRIGTLTRQPDAGRLSFDVRLPKRRAL